MFFFFIIVNQFSVVKGASFITMEVQKTGALTDIVKYIKSCTKETPMALSLSCVLINLDGEALEAFA